jgi:hypothetical protein
MDPIYLIIQMQAMNFQKNKRIYLKMRVLGNQKIVIGKEMVY